ncbi:MAG: hypothetical protein M0C28_05420 [Candidatus Moduliflexus flocculans]|nr:hypothetical protein [Candidatus Moduliflexus flocculans]
MAFSLNGGIQTNIFNGSSFDKALFTADARVGIRLGRSFEISPEVMVVFNYLSMFFEGSGGTLVYPGAMLNYRAGNFFVGAGAVLPWAFYEGESDTRQSRSQGQRRRDVRQLPADGLLPVLDRGRHRPLRRRLRRHHARVQVLKVRRAEPSPGRGAGRASSACPCPSWASRL